MTGLGVQGTSESNQERTQDQPPLARPCPTPPSPAGPTPVRPPPGRPTPARPTPARLTPARPSPAPSSPARLSPIDGDENLLSQCSPTNSRNWNQMLASIFSNPSTISKVNISQEEIVLKREMGFFSSASIFIIITIGIGVFTNPSTVLKRAGTMTEALLVWLFCGFFTFLTAVTYGELVFYVPQSGEKFGYLLAAFSPINKVFGPFPAFISVWIECLFMGPAKTSLGALMFAEYLYIPVDSYLKTFVNFEVNEPVGAKQVIGVAAVGLITWINFRSLKTCVRIFNIFAAFHLFTCFVVIGGGVYWLSLGNVDNFKLLFKDFKGNTTGLVTAAYGAIWSYEGWCQVVEVSEEIKNPLKNIPRTIMIGVPFTIVLYVFMNIAYLSALTVREIVDTSQVVIKFGEKVLGPYKIVIPFGIAITSFGSSMIIQFTTARSFFAAGREGHMLEAASYLHVRRLVPIPAIFMQAVLSTLFLLYIPIVDLIQYTAFIEWTFHGFSFVALIILRVTMPDTYKPYKMPVFVLIILTVFCVLMSFDPLVRAPKTEVFITATFVCFGAIVYYSFVYKEKRIRGMDRFNKFVRDVLDVVPPTSLPEGYRMSITPQRTSTTLAYRLHTRLRHYSDTM